MGRANQTDYKVTIIGCIDIIGISRVNFGGLVLLVPTARLSADIS